MRIQLKNPQQPAFHHLTVAYWQSLELLTSSHRHILFTSFCPREICLALKLLQSPSTLQLIAFNASVVFLLSLRRPPAACCRVLNALRKLVCWQHTAISDHPDYATTIASAVVWKAHIYAAVRSDYRMRFSNVIASP
ncbi:hypothetical protein CRM22_004860 [Opisthorchis felineus]|uniref:Uncharacterized protein n=1 Tax=Opisthorchis felineus TaxID=147828 RepID=A0A4S2LU10_OPIFE|nr:hypothetical protein CRM22_004860 [Opisthorchis felineus]